MRMSSILVLLFYFSLSLPLPDPPRLLAATLRTSRGRSSWVSVTLCSIWAAVIESGSRFSGPDSFGNETMSLHFAVPSDCLTVVYIPSPLPCSGRGTGEGSDKGSPSNGLTHLITRTPAP